MSCSGAAWYILLASDRARLAVFPRVIPMFPQLSGPAALCSHIFVTFSKLQIYEKGNVNMQSPVFMLNYVGCSLSFRIYLRQEWYHSSHLTVDKQLIVCFPKSWPLLFCRFSLQIGYVKQLLAHILNNIPFKFDALVSNIEMTSKLWCLSANQPKEFNFPCNFNLLYLFIGNCRDKYNKAMTTRLSDRSICLDVRGLRERVSQSKSDQLHSNAG